MAGNRWARPLREMTAVWRNRDLRRLLTSLGLWIGADWALLIALSVVAYDAGGAAAVGLVGAARVVPGAVFGPLLAVVTDRWPRPRVLGGTHAVMGVIAVALLAVVLAGTPLPVLILVVAVGSALAAMFKPTTSALLPQLVASPGELVAANAAYGTVEAAATVLGPVLSGALLATVPPAATFGALALLYTVAAVVALTVRTDFQPARVSRRRGLGALADPLRGFPVMVTRPGIRMVFWLMMGQTAMRGLLNVFVVVLALSVAGGVGGLFAAVGVGGLLGATIALGLGGTGRSARRTGLGVLLWGLPVLVIGSWPVTVVVWLALAVIGFGNALEDSYGYSLLHRLLPDELAGRAWAAFYSGSAVTVAVGSLAAPLLIDAFGLRWAMAGTGAVLAALPLLLWSRLRAVDAATEVRPDHLALLQGVPALAPLPMLALERLARSAREVHAEDGVFLIREGERGDRFYVVAEGSVAVTIAGQPVRRMGAGAAFGEIALLRGVPRTATVTAVGPVRLLAVDLEAFVVAVTGHRGTEQAAEATVRQWLTDSPGD